ncbi:MAG: glycoside hydrolase family 13 protein [Candidatus Izemoplasmataceae bacterium]
MHFDMIHHEPKSQYAYLYDKDTVHIRLRTKKGLTNDVKLIFGDPFLYKKGKDTDRYAWAPYEDGIIMEKDYETEFYDFYFIAIKPEYKRVKYAFILDNQYLYGAKEVVDLHEHKGLRFNLFNYFNFPFLNEEDLFKAPTWVKDQVWYSIFPERFNNGNTDVDKPNILPWGKTDEYSNNLLFGGDLKGITEKLEYLSDIGFTGLYLTPIFHASASHKYDTIDYYTIDPSFGTNEDFKKLVEKAHSLNMKVMLDAVFNHCGLKHPYFLDVLENGKKSPYYDYFYIIDENKPLLPIDYKDLLNTPRKHLRKLFEDVSVINYRTFAFTPFMPKLNTMHEPLKKELLDISEYWIKNYDIDGWRLDVSNEIPHAFWRAFKTVVKNAKPDAYIVGENWDNSNPWLKGDQFDAVMNYEILFPIWQFFGFQEDFPKITSKQFKERINKVLTDYPKNVLEAMYNLVDSHDTSRITHICNYNIDVVKLVYLFLFSFPGSPSIFYGGEIGLIGAHDPDNRRCMPWDEESHTHPLKSFIKALITLRQSEESFKTVDFKWHTADIDGLLIYQKNDLLYILNNQDKETSLTIPDDFKNGTLLLGTESSLPKFLSKYSYYVIKQ